jgi:cell division protein FtsB
MEKQCRGIQTRVILMRLVLLMFVVHIFPITSYCQSPGNQLREQARRYREQAQQLDKKAQVLRQRRQALEQEARRLQDEARREAERRRQQEVSSRRGNVGRREHELSIPSWAPLYDEASQLAAQERALNNQAADLFRRSQQLYNESQRADENYGRQRQMEHQRRYQEALERDRQQELERQRKAEIYRSSADELVRTIGSAHCFIATAAYGNSMAEEVTVLRDFRDKYLQTSALGRMFVATYYRNSPPIAAFIAQHDALRAAIRGMLCLIVFGIRHPLTIVSLLGVSVMMFVVFFGKGGHRIRRKSHKF